METLTKMKTSWSFWYHSSKVRDWSRDSYVFLYKTQYAEEFWGVFKLFTQKHFESGIIFIMKDNVFPDWSSPENKNGGFISIKVDTRGKHYSLVHVLRTWIERMISETIIKDVHIAHGISLSPKSGHCILKLWLKNKIKHTQQLLPLDLPLVKTNKFTAFVHKKS